MKKHIIHISPKPDEWVHVHRNHSPAPSSSGGDWWVELLLKVGGGILALWLVCAILKVLMPYLILGFLGWVGLNFFGKGGKR